MTPQTSLMASDQHVKEAMALTAGMITMIDDAVGEIVETLKATGQYDNTVIVFNADHGDYMGDFNLLLKGAWPKESITRVPMIWSDPADRAAKRSGALTSTVDIAPSILERAGVRPYFGMQGQSFLGHLEGGGDSREALLVEYNDGLPRQGFPTPARTRSLTTPRWHLAVYGGQDWGEIYDRRNDPNHTRNLWDDPDHAGVRAELLEQLTQALIAQMDESPRATRLA